ncbi:MAG: sulfite exporter TauE/SafE family protein [Halolamina sp.]
MSQSVPVPATFLVDQFLAHWWVLPASIHFLVALASGVLRALFVSPLCLLVVCLSASQAIGAGLLTEVFGMGNGLVNDVRQRIVDDATAKWLLPGGVPTVVIGAFAAHSVPTTLLEFALRLGSSVWAVFSSLPIRQGSASRRI